MTETMAYETRSSTDEGFAYGGCLDAPRQPCYDFRVQRPRRQLQEPCSKNRRCRSQSPVQRSEPQQVPCRPGHTRIEEDCDRVRNASSGGMVDYITNMIFGLSPSRRRVKSESSGSLEVRRATYWVQQQATSTPCQTQWLSLDDLSVRNSRAGTLAMKAVAGAKRTVQSRLGSQGTDDYTLVAFVQDTENTNLFYLQVRIAPNRFTFFGVNRLSPSVIERGPADTLEMFCSMSPNTV